jgi:acetyl-CoA acetyltransferase
MNTNGGGLSYTHSGMYGMFTLVEAVRQVRGECGARQVAGAKTAICHGLGGMFSSAATLVCGTEIPS